MTERNCELMSNPADTVGVAKLLLLMLFLSTLEAQWLS
jgi:hypothetical protein